MDWAVETRECPHLECAVAEKGFLFDHKDKGHLRSMKLSIKKRRGYNCYMHCRETPDCSIWMIDEKDPEGECTAVQYGAVQHLTVHCSAVQYTIVLYSTCWRMAGSL